MCVGGSMTAISGFSIKTLTVKRDAVGCLWLIFSVVEPMTIVASSTGKSGGFDFGLKTFLTNDEGKSYSSPPFFKQDLKKIGKLNKALSRKVEGSKRCKRARRALGKDDRAVF